MGLPSIALGKAHISDFEEAIKREWITTNGLGGYASSTVLGINTRKYHGLLVAALKPPRNRHVCLAKLDDELVIEGRTCPLYANEFEDGLRPESSYPLESFSLSPLPQFVFLAGGVEIRKILFMLHGANVLIALYEILNRNRLEAQLRIYPAISCRHFHSVANKTTDKKRSIQESMYGMASVSVEAQNSAVTLIATEGTYTPCEMWLEKVYFREEFSRGESFLEDWYRPGFFELKLDEDNSKLAIFTAAGRIREETLKIVNCYLFSTETAWSLYELELKRRKNFLEKFHEEHSTLDTGDWLDWLVLSTDLFVVKVLDNGEFRSVIAGYPWFEDWGRDTFISLPGLMLVTGRFDDARRTFLNFSKYSLNGLIPNLISDHYGKPMYNSVDAPLWYVNAVLQYLKYTGDFDFVKHHLWRDLKLIIDSFQDGTAFNIKVDDDGLLAHGSQLTWMDAVVDGKPATPRAWKAVEVQALWYNALRSLETLARHFNEVKEAEKFAGIAEKAKESFLEKFWNNEAGCLYDVLEEGDWGDPSIRPNQILAVSLDFTMLDWEKSWRVVEAVYRKLWTPYGLRTLTSDDPRYVGVYRGDRRSRDAAYHNGTVWPWLLGPFTTAFIKVSGYSAPMRNYAFSNFLMPLFTGQVYNAGLGAISEIFDGDPPHNPGGCIAQAWSTAEPLRAYVEDVLLIRPKFERAVLGF
ncbi:MAG: amylo-alpha-1,6-glucosidase [Candidatus Bathyarchaeota archaeon]|nr:amylo-alpha-1,6-glucosidase [Candidatus Bathyarchaeota archaeon]